MPLQNLILTVTLVANLAAAAWPAISSETPPRPTTRPEAMHDLAHVLENGGYSFRPDVVVHVSGQPAAWGFSRHGCDGVILMTVLPDTAQSWMHIAPAIKRPAFVETYLHRSMVYDNVPTLTRLWDRLLSDLGTSDRDTLKRSTIALAESGTCGLSIPAIALIKAHVDIPARERHTHSRSNAQ